MRILLEQLQSTCNELKDHNEVAIIKQYSNISRRYVRGISGKMKSGDLQYILCIDCNFIIDSLILIVSYLYGGREITLSLDTATIKMIIIFVSPFSGSRWQLINHSYNTVWVDCSRLYSTEKRN